MRRLITLDEIWMNGQNNEPFSLIPILRVQVVIMSKIL